MNNEQKKPKTGKILTSEAVDRAALSFCLDLKSKRIELGLTPFDVHRDLKINLPQVYKDENGDNNITLKRLLKYINYYGIKIKF